MAKCSCCSPSEMVWKMASLPKPASCVPQFGLPMTYRQPKAGLHAMSASQQACKHFCAHFARPAQDSHIVGMDQGQVDL